MTADATPRPSHRGRSLGLRFAIASVLGIALVAGAGGAGPYATVTVADEGTHDVAPSKVDAPAPIRVDVPLPTPSPAVETADLEAATAAAARMGSDVVLTHGTQTWTLPAAKIGALITFSRNPDGGYVPVVEGAGIDTLIAPIAKDINRTAVNAGFRFSSGRVVVASLARTGRRLDLAKTHAAIVAQLMARATGSPAAPIALPVAAIQPRVTTAQARAYAPRMRAISTWTTWFPIWSHNAFGANIWVPASIINGYVVQPGQTFDFWKVVGPVTRERGYGLGGAIIDGHTQAQGALGGGICSCSTTLFNAALRAGFKMGARRNHYYYIDRYPVGLDATVFISGGSRQTMSWTNDSPYPVLIRGINTRANGKGYVTFKLYSVPNHRRVTVSAPTVRNVRQAGDSTVRSTTLRAGYSQRVEEPADGMDVWRTVSVYQNDKLVSRRVYYSHYSTVTGVVLIGTGGPSAPTSVP